MDKFETAMADWAKMSEAEKKHLEKESRGRCLWAELESES